MSVLLTEILKFTLPTPYFNNSHTTAITTTTTTTTTTTVTTATTSHHYYSNFLEQIYSKKYRNWSIGFL
ncbi:hypothetical protein T12_6980 [Trichinella patagoniensis]|uniref:Uncharacterized protein n=1 Tax=Trichinella patagoniensis TaxID=990121 RepID=A0A0V0ZN78_9BILA|nr:hypothetical protein T12_6980 [Trichinella patagoniensis]